jgi:hypothetical protein
MSNEGCTVLISTEQIIRETMKRTRQRILAAMEQQIAAMPEGWAKRYYLHHAGVIESHLAAVLRGRITSDDFFPLRKGRTFLRDIPYIVKYYCEHQEEQEG